MEIAVVVLVVLALVAVQVRRRGSKLQRAEDPPAGAEDYRPEP